MTCLPVRGVPPASHEMAAAGGAVCKGSSLAALAPCEDGLRTVAGPGWLIIFAALGILATEYAWAARLLGWVRAYVRRWTRWIAEQPLWLAVLFGLISLLIIAGIAVAAWLVPRRGL